MKKLLFVIFCCVLLNSEELKIAVAANMSYAIEEIKNEFLKTHPNDSINVTLGSSGKLVAQIKNGAPFEVFLSADENYANELFNSNFALKKPVIYAKGEVAVLFVNPNLKASNSAQLQTALNDAKSVVVANPDLAPYGKASTEALKNMGIFEKIKDKIVWANSIGDALTLSLKAGDIGFVALSALKSPKMRNKNLNFLKLENSAKIAQSMVLLKNSSPLANEFFEFLKNENTQKILSRYGYDF